MFNFKVNGHGTIKKLRTGAVISVLSTSALMGGVVSADETTTANAETATEVVATPTEEVTTPVEEVVAEPVQEVARVTEEQVATAKAESDQATQAVTDQETVVGNLQESISTGETSVNDLQGQIDKANEVTPEVVAEAQQEAETASNSLSTAEETVVTAQNSATNASEAVVAQEGVVAEAQSNADKTASAVADSEKKVSDLSGKVDTSQLESDVADLTKTLADDKEALKSAQDSLDAARLADTNKAEAIKTQEGVVADKEAENSTAQAELTTATTAKSEADSKVSEAKSTLDTAKAGRQVTETVQVGTETITTGAKVSLKDGVAYSGWFETNGIAVNDLYIKAIKALASGSGSTDAVKQAIKVGVFGMTDNSGDDLNTVSGPTNTGYQAWKDIVELSFSGTDSSTLLDPHDLTDAQLTDLAMFYAALVNELRAKVGTEPLKVTSASVKTGKDTVTTIFNKVFPNYKDMNTAQLANNGFWNSMTGLNPDTGAVNDKPLKAIGGASIKDAVTSSKGSNLVMGHKSASYDNNDGRKVTMKELKYNVLATLGNQVFGFEGNGVLGEAFGGLNGGNSNSYDTALYVLGLKGNYNSVGLDFDFTNMFNGMVDQTYNTYVVFGNDSATGLENKYQTYSGGVTTTKPIYETRTVTVVDQQSVADAQAKYDEALSQSEKATADYNAAKAKADTSQKALDDAKQALENLKTGVIDIPALEKAVLDAETKLAIDQSSLQSTKETLAVAKASAVDKANALAKAKADLVSAQSANETALGVVIQEKETLEVLRNAEKVAQLALTDAIAKRDTAKQDSAEATAKYEELAKALENRDAVVTALTAKLDEAKQALAVARADYETAKDLLANLKVTAKEKLEAYRELADLKAKQDAADAEAKRLQDLKDKADSITKAGGIPTPVVDGSGKVIDFVDGKKATTTVVPTKVVKQACITEDGDKITYSRVEKYKALPQTGTEESLLGLLGASMLLGLGLSVTGKRRKTR